MNIKLIDNTFELVDELADSGQAVIYRAGPKAATSENQEFQFAFKVYKRTLPF